MVVHSNLRRGERNGQVSIEAPRVDWRTAPFMRRGRLGDLGKTRGKNRLRTGSTYRLKDSSAEASAGASSTPLDAMTPPRTREPGPEPRRRPRVPRSFKSRAL